MVSFITQLLLTTIYTYPVGAFIPSILRNGRNNGVSSRQNVKKNAISTVVFSSSSDIDNNDNSKDEEVNQYLDKATKLRKEAEELEAVMRNRDSSSTTLEKPNSESDLRKVVSYKSLNDSTWMISYRFASDPVLRDNDSNASDENAESYVKPTFYSGKVSIRLKDDGYTELLNSPNDDKDSPSSSSTISYEKFWGWDEETSREDGKQYLSFSADLKLPSTDPNYQSGNSNRFYFNSQVENFL